MFVFEGSDIDQLYEHPGFRTMAGLKQNEHITIYHRQHRHYNVRLSKSAVPVIGAIR